VISIRPIAADDHEWIYRACQDPEIQRFTLVPRPYTMEHANQFVISKAGEFMVWAIQKFEEPIGVISIHDICDKTGVASIGYWVAPWGRRLGGASSAIELVADYVRKNSLAREVQAKIAETNEGSRRSAKRAGLSISNQLCETCPDGELQVNASIFSIRFSTLLP
jgi:RimJ/RimL family protein N-acetyltransferase